MTAHGVRRLPHHQGPAAWDAILPPAPAYPPIKANTTADFAIVGGGFAGLSAARRLTQLAPGARVVLLEAGRIAEGPAGRNSGFMIDLPHDLSSENYSGDGDAAQIALNRQAIGFAREAVEDYGIDPAFFDPAGKINGAVSGAAHARNLSYGAHLDRLGEPCELLDAAQMAEVTGSRNYRSGLYTPGTVMLQPAGYVRGLAAGLSSEGVRIAEGSPVTRIARVGTDWRLETPGGAVTAGRVILAVNGHLESFGFKRGRLMHVFLFASMTEELPRGAVGGQDRWGVTPSDPMGTTMRRIDGAQGGDRIVTRSMAVLNSRMRTWPRELHQAAAQHRRRFLQRFPGLKGVRQEFSWSGQLCLSRNGVAVMRELEPRLFSACVQNGLGTTRGTLTGIGAAELACGVQSEITRHFGAEEEPQRLPWWPLRDVGAFGVLRWKGWRARRE